MLKRHYDYASSGYSPEAESLDSSKPLPGSVNSYEQSVPTPPSPADFETDNKPILATNETVVEEDGTVTEPE